MPHGGKPPAPKKVLSLCPMDFYRFRHTTWRHRHIDRMMEWSAPFWVVGVSPFEKEIGEDEGYVTHLGFPRFLARWSFDLSRFQLAQNQKHFFDDDLGLLIYEVSLLDEFAPNCDEWLFEAACAVAYSKGLIAISAIDEDEDDDGDDVENRKIVSA